MTKSSSSKTYALLGGWVIVATGAGLYLTHLLTKPKNKEFIAPMAAVRQCGPTPITAEEQGKIIAEWIIKPEKLATEIKASLARTIKSLPEEALIALKKNHLKVAIDEGETPFTCTIYENSSAKSGQPSTVMRSAVNCLRSTGKDSVALILGRPRIDASNGKPRAFSEKDLIDETLLPEFFWTIFEGLYKSSDSPGKLDPNSPSISNISDQIKRYVVDSYNFSENEQEFYYKEFGASGTANPAFATRTLVLTARSLYCSSESYTKLAKTQPEATKRFMSIYGCALGKPWHMQASDYSELCPVVAKASSGG